MPNERGVCDVGRIGKLSTRAARMRTTWRHDTGEMATMETVEMRGRDRRRAAETTSAVDGETG